MFLIEKFLEQHPEIDIVAAMCYSYDDVVDDMAHLARTHQPVTKEVFNVYTRVWAWRQFVSEMAAGKPLGVHCGDCTKQPAPCLRCHVERYTTEALDLIRRYRAGS